MTAERVSRLDAVLAMRQPDLTVFAENLHKPRNFSAMVRCCDAVGVNEMHVLPGEDNLRTHWNTSQGAEKWMRIRTHESSKEACEYLKSNNFQLLAAHLSDTAIDYRYITVGAALAMLVFSIGLIATGTVKFKAFPDLEGNTVDARPRPAVGMFEDIAGAVQAPCEFRQNAILATPE